ncbi:hypothetical protein QYE76_022104 [Lolium multiflorum]|uniref:Retrotransposon gag domain-containing protein n=1 Tax=Lolium multiflorum TaxID=4521 RepID=A0AAD8RAC1_LOLMU|nr:hypothetical protein QYE76_022104 [Lolium multiflorum]
MTTDTAGMPRPKNVAGATANLAAYLINQRPEGSMAQAHRGALESLAILGKNLVPQKEKTTAQASGSKYHARDARDEITQSRIDKARRRRAARKDNDSDSSDEDQEYDGELRGADCLSYKIRETMPPKKFKPTPTDAAKYDGQQEPRSWIDDYLQTVILHKGNQIAAMQCLQLYLKDSARAWLRGLPKGSIKSWDDLVDAFVANFQATYKRPVGIEELRNCQQKQKESMRSYIGRFTKLLNAAEDVSVDRAIDAFSDGVRRESYIEELGRKKPKTITKLMEIANSWADGEDNVRRPRQRSDDEDDDQPKHDSGGRRDRHKRRKNHNYDDNNLVAAGYSDRHDDRYDERRDDRQDGNRNNSGNRGNYKPRQQRTPELPYAEQINAPCYLHSCGRSGEKRCRIHSALQTVRNRCYSARLNEKEVVELAALGLAAPLKDLALQAEYNSLAHMVQKLTLYEQRHPELYQDKFIKRPISLVETEDVEDSEDQEVAVAEWARGQSLSCKWVKPQGPAKGFDFDIAKLSRYSIYCLRKNS